MEYDTHPWDASIDYDAIDRAWDDKREQDVLADEHGKPGVVMSDGVWAVIDNDYGEAIQMVFPTEIEALRILNGSEYRRVAFIPWGMSLMDVKDRDQGVAS